MHQIRFLLGLCPRPRWGTYCSPSPLAVFRGPTSKVKKGKGKAVEKEKGKGRWEGGERP